MALFGRKKKTEEVVEEVKVKKADTKTTKTAVKKVSKKETKSEVKETSTPAVKAKKEEVVKVEGKSDYGYRITEKATRLADKNVYVLNVPKTINKTQLKFDLEAKYKVTVLNINIVNSPKKEKFYRGKWGTRGGGKKAYITLKAGDSIVL
jgi:ribosomal protein L23